MELTKLYHPFNSKLPLFDDLGQYESHTIGQINIPVFVDQGIKMVALDGGKIVHVVVPRDIDGACSEFYPFLCVAFTSGAANPTVCERRH